jgi:hypothetical protein
LFVGCTGLVVQDLQIHWETAGRQASHDGVVLSNAIGVAPALEGVLEDKIAICVIGNHVILIPRVGLDGESSHVVRIEFADGVDANKDFVGRNVLCWGCNCGLGWAKILLLVSQMTHNGLVCIRTVSCHVGVGESIKGVAVASLDGLEPCLLDWEA